MLALSLGTEGEVAYRLQELANARAFFAEGLTLSQEVGEIRYAAEMRCGLGLVCAAQGEKEAAGNYFDAALQTFVELGDSRQAAPVLEGLAELVRAENFLRAARLWGAADALRKAVGAPRAPTMEARYARAMTDTRAQLGDAAFDAAWAAGGALTLNEMAQI